MSDTLTRRTRFVTGVLAIVGGVAVLADAVLNLAGPVSDLGLALTAAALFAGAWATYRADEARAAVLAGCACCLLAGPVVAFLPSPTSAVLGALVLFGGVALVVFGFRRGTR